MSYILDALKKSDQQRQLHTRTKEKQRWQISDAPARKRKPLWQPVVLLVICAVAVSGWLSNDSQNDKAPKTIQEFVPLTTQPAPSEAPTSSDTDPGVASSTEALPVPVNQTTPLKIQPNLASPELLKKKQGQLREKMLSFQNTENSTSAPETLTQSPPALSPNVIATATDVSDTNVPVADSTDREEAQAHVQNISEPQQPIEAEQESVPLVEETHPLASSILHLSELPPSVVQQLPRFDVSVSIFSKRALQRRARINGHMYYQGDSLTEKLTLYEITPKSLIFDFEGQLFRVSL